MDRMCYSIIVRGKANCKKGKPGNPTEFYPDHNVSVSQKALKL